MSIRFGMKRILLLSVLAGCAPELSDADRIRLAYEASLPKAVPVAGTVFVDDRPEADIVISVYKSDGSKPLPPNDFVPTNASGKFAFSTYSFGDGLAPGDYKLTFQWRKIKFRAVDPVFEGPDKLKGRYSNLAKSEFSLQVVEGQPQQELKLELKSK